MPRHNKPRPDQLLNKIREALVQLRLPIMAEQLDEVIAAGAGEGATGIELLWRIVEPQLRVRRERAVERRIRQAKLPSPRTLDGFDFAFQPTLDRERVMQFATLGFVRRGQNLLIGGMSGTGKSHIVIALGYLACAAGIRTLYTTSAAMLATLNAALATNALDETIRPYRCVPLLIVDELGLDRPEREDNRDAQLFYKVIAPRYEASLPTMITSNVDWEDWGKYLGDDLATVAIIDRLIHHGHLLNIEGPSYRAAQHAKLNSSPTAPEHVGD